MVFRVVARTDRMRAGVEHEIRAVYGERFTARLNTLPGTLVADVGDDGRVECAAGIRFGACGLFSERYLDRLIDIVLEARFERPVDRRAIVEVCHLVSRRPGRSLRFVADIVAFAERIGAEWAIFTATRALRLLLRRAGLNMTELARALPEGVPNPSDWGSYYDHDPRVMAVHRETSLIHPKPILFGAACDQRPYA